MRKILYTQRLTLKPLNTEHCTDQYLSWLNDNEVTKYLEVKSSTKKELLTYLTNIESKGILAWAIFITNSKTHIGNIKIDPISKKHKTATYGIMMGNKEFWGKGFAKEASISVCNYCFSQLGLQKIKLGVLEENKAAIELYKKLSFQIEGTLKNEYIYNNKAHNAILMALYNPKNN